MRKPTLNRPRALPPCLLAAVLLSACGDGDARSGPDPASVGEARALEDAAAMLEEQRMAAPEAGEATADGGS